jgi:hypothetical protein
MRLPQITSGNDILLPVTLKKDDAVFAIDIGATIKARLVSEDHFTEYCDEVVQSSATPGANWPASLVVISIPSSTSSTITKFGPAHLEIQVDDSYIQTWFVEIDVKRGTIS